jgi:hypothetical protein
MVWPQGNKAMCDVANAAEVDRLSRSESDFAIELIRAGFELFDSQLVIDNVAFRQTEGW